MTRRVLLRALGLLPVMRYGTLGQYRRRPDQQSDPPPSAIAPTQAAGVLRARLVIVFGTGPGSGIFVYSGPPAHGNLVESITASAGTDPFGNPFKAGFTSYDNNFGNVAQITGSFINMFTASAQSIQLTSSGLTIFNSHGATIFALDETRDAFLLYADTGTAAQGALLASSASAAGTDSFGNTFEAGQTAYVNIAGSQWAANLASSVTVVGALGALAALSLQNLASPFNQPPSVAGNGSASLGAELVMSSGKAASGSVQSGLLLQDSTGSSVTGGQISAEAGKLQVIAADGNTYRTERLDVALGTSFSINSTSPLTIFSASLGVGTYEIDIWGVTLNTTAADGAQLKFAFTGTATDVLVDYTSTSTTPVTVGYLASATLTTTFNTQGSANNQKLDVHLGITVSVAGTLTFTGAEQVAANPVTMFAGSRMRVCPV